jgi:CO/xanthine dehydrogenase Mo-binding subunit
MTDNFRSNKTAPEARMALEQMKAEAARELDIAKPEIKERANMTSRQNGYLGGRISEDANSDGHKK